LKHREVALAAHKKWRAKLDRILVKKPIRHPFRIVPPAKITKKHIRLLKQWDLVSNSTWDSMDNLVRNSVDNSVGSSVGNSMVNSVRYLVGDSVMASVWRYSMDNLAWTSAGWSSVMASIWAYTGSFFKLPRWEYAKHSQGEYPYASAVKLWELGLVPSFDGEVWRLHGHKNARVVFAITAEKLRNL
jgi:hypothetical protein